MLTGCSVFNSQIAGSVNEVDSINDIEQIEEKENMIIPLNKHIHGSSKMAA